MWLYDHRTIGCTVFILLSIIATTINGQCSTTACVDCFSWCPTAVGSCNSLSLVKKYCKKSCNNCPSRASACKALSCTQRCIQSDDGSTATCGCFQGYRLKDDGKSCEDINECAQNKTICQGNKPICVNIEGDYACTSCEASKDGIWSYYSDRSKCCRINEDSACGKSVNNKPGRIVNGSNAQIQNWPWMVHITTGNNICGGSLLTKNYVLTAGHCVKNKRYDAITLVAGVYNVSDNSNLLRQTFKPQKIYLHPNYSFPNNDIAIILLDKPASLSQFVNTVCLPGGEQPQVGETCYATGYGTTSFRGDLSKVLQEVDLPIVDNDVCEAAYSNLHEIYPNIQMCAGYPAGGKDSCQGDSGGPLVCQRCNNCDWYVAGINSFGYGCAKAGYYGVYTRVTAFESWITNITNLPLSYSTCVKPTWGDWGDWTKCSVACGNNGTQTRSRFCQNGIAGDPGCEGSKVETNICSGPKCAEAVWSLWKVGECSVTCGRGSRLKTRSCVGGSIGDSGCDTGGDTEEENCNIQNCPTWNTWTTWSVCSATCGGGRTNSMRTCNNYGVSGAKCNGKSSRSQSCNEQDCPSWGDYSEWSKCTVTCGSGKQERSRVCSNGKPGQNGCLGPEKSTRDCNTAVCEEWSQWTACSATCGGGTRTRTKGSMQQDEVCNSQNCPRWGKYGKWSDCNKDCGGGVQSSVRVCLGGNVGDIGCIGSTSRERSCNTHDCNSWSKWTYTACSKTCGDGRRTKSRECLGGIVPGVGCDGESQEVENCNTQCCPEWTDFGAFSDCSVSCGEGVQKASRKCKCGKPGDVGCEGSRFQSRPCNSNPCPEWSQWTACSATCGGGTRTRTKGSMQQDEVCNSQNCARWGKYGKWSDCNKDCGGGVQSSVRVCLGGNVGDIGCIGSASRERSCNTQCCTEWTNFGAFSDCSVSCGGGVQKASRECKCGKPGDVGCEGSRFQSRSCNSNPCPEFSQWTDFSDCDATCGGGTQTRTRQCSIPGECQPDQYGVATSQSKSCNTQDCPGEWTPWQNDGECSVTCGKGKQAQIRQCIGGVVGGVGCTGSDKKTIDCALNDCPSNWGPFGAYGDCSVTCGGGTQSRSRNCIGSTAGSGKCLGSASEERSCNTNPCSGCAGRTNVGDITTCVSFAKFGYCSSYEVYMKNNCNLACCQRRNNIGEFASKTCNDIYPKTTCNLYSRSGYCTWPAVRNACAKTCGC